MIKCEISAQYLKNYVCKAKKTQGLGCEYLTVSHLKYLFIKLLSMLFTYLFSFSDILIVLINNATITLMTAGTLLMKSD